MKIEDRIEQLERIVQRMHAASGHEWFKWFMSEGFAGNKRRNIPAAPSLCYRICYCGVNGECSKEEYVKLPDRDWPDPERDRY